MESEFRAALGSASILAVGFELCCCERFVKRKAVAGCKFEKWLEDDDGARVFDVAFFGCGDEVDLEQ